MAGKRGRLKKENTRDNVLEVRITAKEKEMLLEISEKRGTTCSETIRDFINIMYNPICNGRI